MIAAIERLTGLEWKGQGTVFLVASGHGGTHWIAATFYLLLPFITRDLGLSYAEAGMLVAVFHLSAFAANFGSGLVVDVTGKRVVYQVLSLVVGAGALLGCGGAQSVLWLFPMVVLIGATNNLWHPPAISFLSEHFPKQRGYVVIAFRAAESDGATVVDEGTHRVCQRRTSAPHIRTAVLWPGCERRCHLPGGSRCVVLVLLLLFDLPQEKILGTVGIARVGPQHLGCRLFTEVPREVASGVRETGAFREGAGHLEVRFVWLGTAHQHQQNEAQ